MKVLKFGGSSVANAEAISKVKAIAASNSDTPIIIVVSALGGITDHLLNTAFLAADGNIAYENEFKSIVGRHETVVNELFEENENRMRLNAQMKALFGELINIYKGVYLIKDLSSKTLDTIVSYGERLSSIIVAQAIPEAKWMDSREFIKTELKHGKHVPNTALTTSLIRSAFKYLPKISVLGGFIASDEENNEITNLGRGGSDYTASLIATALNAEQLEIWTDVDGFMTADPRVINKAYTIEELSYDEATELCNFGAKVIYPPTIYPVCHTNIPILVKNTFNPSGPGTVISASSTKISKQVIKGISSINNTSLITVHGLGMVGVIGVNYRIFKALAKNGISVFLVAQASSENSTSIGVRSEDTVGACKALDDEFAKEIEQGIISKMRAQEGLATVAVVGNKMKGNAGIAGRLFQTLGRNGINVIACAQGASEMNISIVVDGHLLKKALNVIHDSFFLSEYKELNLYICGTGTVGASLIDQIKSQQQRLMDEQRLKLNVVGIATSKKLLINRDGIDLDEYKKLLDQVAIPSSPEILVQEIIKTNIFNSAFVDCTASQDVASLYKNFLAHNISIVAANKIAASSSYENYIDLKREALKKGVKFLFETNVGAGLPIINTINDLINSGDKILKIEAVLSGTLNFIFNEISATVPFSQTIKRAQEEGYSEPDPRIDLSGTDVIRKLVILAREAGYPLEQSDVETNLFVPNAYFEGELADFWKGITALDTPFEQDREKLEKEQKKWRFVAKLDQGKASVGLEEVSSSHPFYTLEGSNNVILLTTERYKDYPMMIQGYGAGADVTAAGVFADIMSIANI
ncbi:bifunctional aspartate kinase/homoserine dehydrogenase I [Bacteroides propionicifaciens]|uniref:bifunctional aspartate kinase/homoserine dehydrogenase I n=1 Tax=Bacteroides propionicifaciens TaxID=392838 RepID=UPI000377BFCE|nr:bifunctional aspartate kinase/homoserine dehydrogenase I [Bacteroides propionicifaciens]